MADFQSSLIDITTNEPSVTLSCDNELLTVVDKSNYDTATEGGHARANFTDYRKLIITNPNTSTYTYSSLGDGDNTIPAASVGDDTVNYSYGGDDGIYTFLLISIPTYDNAVAYVALDDYVYYSGSIYKCILNTTGNLPTDTTYWTEITDNDDISTKYATEQKVLPTCNLLIEMAQKAYNALCVAENLLCSTDILCTNQCVTQTELLYMARFALEVAVAQQDWTKAQDIYNFIEKLIACPC